MMFLGDRRQASPRIRANGRMQSARAASVKWHEQNDVISILQLIYYWKFSSARFRVAPWECHFQLRFFFFFFLSRNIDPAFGQNGAYCHVLFGLLLSQIQ